MAQPLSVVSDTTPVEFACPAARIARADASVRIFHDLADVEPIWRAFEADAWMTPYQRFDFVDAWQRSIGARAGIVPAIVTIEDQRGPLALLPLGMTRKGPLRTLRFLGGKHANYNVPLTRWTETDEKEALIRTAFDAIRKAAIADLVWLENQPVEWLGAANPLRIFPRIPSASAAYSAALGASADDVLPTIRSRRSLGKLNRSQRRLAEHYGDVALRRVMTVAEAERVLAAFHHQKSARLKQLGIPNVFDKPEVRAFLHDLALRDVGSERPPLDLYWLEVGGDIAWTGCGVTTPNRFGSMINSFDIDEERHVPIGDIALKEQLADLCGRGFTCFDLGIGEAEYKDHWCKITDEMFVTIVPLTPFGRGAAPLLRGYHQLKRQAKKSGMVATVYNRLRRALSAGG